MLPVAVSAVGGNNIPNSVGKTDIILKSHDYQRFGVELKQLCYKKTDDPDENYLVFYGAIKNFFFTYSDTDYLNCDLSRVPAFQEIAHVEQGDHMFYAYFAKSAQLFSRLLVTDRKITEADLLQTEGEGIRIQVEIASRDDFADFRKQLPARTGVANSLLTHFMDYYADNADDSTKVKSLVMHDLQEAYKALLVLYQQSDRDFTPRDLMIYEKWDAFALKMESGKAYCVWTNGKGEQEKHPLFNVDDYSLADLKDQFKAFGRTFEEPLAKLNEQEKAKILRNFLISYLESNPELLQAAVAVFQGSKTIEEVDSTLMRGVVNYLSMCSKSEGESYVVIENNGQLDGRQGVSLDQWEMLQDPDNSTVKAHFIELVTLAVKFKEIFATVITTLRAKLDDAGVESGKMFDHLEQCRQRVMMEMGIPSQALQTLCCKVNAETKVDFISDQNWSTALDFYKAYAQEVQ